jgi:hypothetical protein
MSLALSNLASDRQQMKLGWALTGQSFLRELWRKVRKDLISPNERVG